MRSSTSSRCRACAAISSSSSSTLTAPCLMVVVGTCSCRSRRWPFTAYDGRLTHAVDRVVPCLRLRRGHGRGWRSTWCRPRGCRGRCGASGTSQSVKETGQNAEHALSSPARRPLGPARPGRQRCPSWAGHRAARPRCAERGRGPQSARAAACRSVARWNEI